MKYGMWKGWYCIRIDKKNRGERQNKPSNTGLANDHYCKEIQEGGDICTHIADSLHCTAETNRTL